MILAIIFHEVTLCPSLNLILRCYEEAKELNFFCTYLLEPNRILRSLKEYLKQPQVLVRISSSKLFPTITRGYTIHRMIAGMCEVDDLPTKLR